MKKQTSVLNVLETTFFAILGLVFVMWILNLLSGFFESVGNVMAGAVVILQHHSGNIIEFAILMFALLYAFNQTRKIEYAAESMRNELNKILNEQRESIKQKMNNFEQRVLNSITDMQKKLTEATKEPVAAATSNKEVKPPAVENPF